MSPNCLQRYQQTTLAGKENLFLKNGLFRAVLTLSILVRYGRGNQVFLENPTNTDLSKH